MPHLNYLAIGDSLTKGVGAFLFAPNFVRGYQRYLEEAFGEPFGLRVVARNGATGSDILRMLFRPDVSRSVSTADVITITAGGNDLLQAGRIWMETGNTLPVYRAVEVSLSNVEKMLQFIRQSRVDSRPYLIRIPNLYNPLPHIPHTAEFIQLFNTKLNALQLYPNVRVADIYHAFRGREPQLLSFDRIHPNPAGYAVMAEATAALGYRPLLPTI